MKFKHWSYLKCRILEDKELTQKIVEKVEDIEPGRTLGYRIIAQIQILKQRAQKAIINEYDYSFIDVRTKD